MTQIQGWHFVNNTLRDGSSIPPDGEWLRYDGDDIRMCNFGLHASQRIIDALAYAPGSLICRVSCDEIVDQLNDKLICRMRRINWRINGEKLLREFARKCALDVIHLWEAPENVKEYLETGEETMRAAAWTAASDAAWNTASDAARTVAWAATNDAVRTATWTTAWNTARAAAWCDQNEWLTKQILQNHSNTGE